ncbi:AAA family ATPase [Roseibium salinum]|uniref:AAA family ATPase n=1 Tax=Roseibium salinum TaxID=1604349 RepID=UPI00361AF873
MVTLPVVNAASLAHEAVKPRSWHVEDLIPGNTVTLLNGDGGTGKSLLALQLAVATCSDGYWAGRKPEQGRVIYLGAEDDIEELHRRLVDICADAAIDLESLHDLDIVPLAGRDALLAVPARKTNVLEQTPLFSRLEERVSDFKPAFVVLDTLSDLFGGEENQRAQARQFISLLRGLCLDHGVTILLLAHPSLTGMSSGSGLSGSTAWNNSVRSRLYLERIKDSDGKETDTEMRVLTTKKANYTKTGTEIRLNWHQGVFKAAQGKSSLSDIAAQAKAERVFMSLLAAFTREGRNVSESTGHAYAPKKFADDSRAEGVTRNEFKGNVKSVCKRGNPNGNRWPRLKAYQTDRCGADT